MRFKPEINRLFALQLFAMTIAVLFSPHSVSAATYYLDAVSGDDMNPGSSERPWKSLARAYTWYIGDGPKVQEGDTVILRNGSYGTFQETTHNGPTFLLYRSKWVTYRADIGATPSLTRIDIHNLDKWYGDGNGSSYLVFDGFAIESVSLKYTSHVQIVNCTIRGKVTDFDGYYAPYVAGGGICSVRAHHITIRNCDISLCRRGIESSGDHWDIYDNTIHHYGEDAIQCQGMSKTIENNTIYAVNKFRTYIDIYGTISYPEGQAFVKYETVVQKNTGAEGVVYTHTGSGQKRILRIWQTTERAFSTGATNRIIGQTSGAVMADIYKVDPPHCDGIQFDTSNAGNIIIRKNHIAPGMGQGIKIATRTQIPNVLIENNLIFDTNNWSMLLRGLRDGINIYSNTFDAYCRLETKAVTVVDNYFNNIGKLALDGDKQQNYVRIINHGNNIFSNNPDGRGSARYPFVLDSETEPTNQDFSSGIFTDFANRDFTLCAGSPAIDSALSSRAPSYDIAGNLRDAAPDIGCYEYGGTARSNRPPDLQDIAPQSAVVGQKVTITARAEDPDGDVLTYSFSSSPSMAGATINALSGLFTWTPANGEHGQYSLTLSAADGKGGTDSTSVAVTVAPADTDPPTVESVSAGAGHVHVVFSEAVETASAENRDNYAIKGITVTDVQLNSDQDEVVLSTSVHAENEQYTLTIENIRDTDGNPMSQAIKPYRYDTGLVGSWQFSESSGNATSDSSGSDNTGALNGPLWGGDEGLRFDGTDDYVEVPDSDSLDIQNEITLSLWVKLNAYDTDWPKLIIKPYQSYADPWELYALDLGHYGSTPRLIITNGTPGGDGAVATDSSYTISLNQWHHIVGTYDGSIMSVYVDGDIIATRAAELSIGTNDMPLYIGGRGGVNGFNGVIKDVRIYNRALDADGVRSFYKAGNLRAKVPLKDFSAKEILDASGKNDPGDLKKGAQWARQQGIIVEGIDDYLGSPVLLDGSDDHVDLGAGYNLNLTGNLTVTAWICPENFGAGGYGRIVDKGDGASGFAFYVKQSTRGLAYLTYGGNNINSDLDVIELDQWQHVAVTYSDTSDTVAFYVNGTVAGGGTYLTNPADSGGEPLIIGNRLDALDRGFKGMLSDVRIFSRTLTAEEISAIYRTYEVKENKNLSFEVSVGSDPSGLGYVLGDSQTLPAGATFTDNIFTWRPWYNQAGSYEITFEVPGQPDLTQSVPIIVDNASLRPWYRHFLDSAGEY